MVKQSIDQRTMKLEKANKKLKEKNKKYKKTIDEKDFEIKYLGEELSKKNQEIDAMKSLYFELKKVLEAKDKTITDLMNMNKNITSVTKHLNKNKIRKPKEKHEPQKVSESGDSVLSQFIQRIRSHQNEKQKQSSFSSEETDNQV
jgi:SMC interacting uncharacterized protein involved in chromosome segregation